jgi:hypothetical protein
MVASMRRKSLYNKDFYTASVFWRKISVPLETCRQRQGHTADHLAIVAAVDNCCWSAMHNPGDGFQQQGGESSLAPRN